MRVGITGHRPERITEPEPIKDLISEAIQFLGATRFYQGMAAGVDLWSAKEAWKLKIPYVAVRPWAGHQPRFDDVMEYWKVMEHADEIIDVLPNLTYPGPWCYEKRNQAIVDNVDAMIAVWDGNPWGGTFNCVQAAQKKNLPVLRVDPKRRVLGYV